MSLDNSFKLEKMRKQLIVERVLFELGSHHCFFKVARVSRDKLAILLMTGNKVSRHSLRKVEGRGCRVFSDVISIYSTKTCKFRLAAGEVRYGVNYRF